MGERESPKGKSNEEAVPAKFDFIHSLNDQGGSVHHPYRRRTEPMASFRAAGWCREGHRQVSRAGKQPSGRPGPTN